MTPARINRVLQGSAALLIVAAVGVVAVAMQPLDVAAPDETARGSATTTSQPAAVDDQATKMLATLEPVLARPLRGRTNENAAPAAPRPAVASRPIAAPAAITLIGTIGQSTALLRTAEGAVVAKSVGQEFAGVEIVAVRPNEADIRTNGRVTTIRKPPEAHAP